MAPGIDTAAQPVMAGPSPTVSWAGAAWSIRVLGPGRPGPGNRGQGRPGAQQSFTRQRRIALPLSIRNRLMSGMGDAVLFLGGRIRGGGMITVECALEQNRMFRLSRPGGEGWLRRPMQILQEADYRCIPGSLLRMCWRIWAAGVKRACQPKAQSATELDGDQQTVLSHLLTVEGVL